jgi:hypothetical protein
MHKNGAGNHDSDMASTKAKPQPNPETTGASDGRDSYRISGKSWLPQPRKTRKRESSV